MRKLLENNSLILLEGAVIERLRREENVVLHKELMNAPLIYDEAGKNNLGKIYQEYIDVAFKAQVPFLMCSPTWRTNYERVVRGEAPLSINYDAVQFMREIRSSQGEGANNIKIGGMIGCKNDGYRPDEGLSVDEAVRFHSWQIDTLAEAGADFLIAVTLPNVREAEGIARAMDNCGKPYIISFIIARDGRLLDGTELTAAVKRIDHATDKGPIGYMVNCSYPTFLCAEKQPSQIFDRLIGFQGNASSRDHSELDAAHELQAEEVKAWADEMIKLNREYHLKILGGCCGTNPEYLQYMVDHI